MNDQFDSFAWPPPSIAPYVATFSVLPCSDKLGALGPYGDAAGWGVSAERLGLRQAVEALGLVHPLLQHDPGRALAFAFLNLPVPERYELSRRFPMDAFACAYFTWADVTGCDENAIHNIMPDFLAPDVHSALHWCFEFIPRAILQARFTATIH